ncbi:MAG: DUF1420 family protein [Bacteroidetes bacterium]|nr:DUF1420 family protein [Bacteroidota bacterium]
MMNLNDYFISAPLSAIYTVIMGLSMVVFFDRAGKALFRSEEVWARGLYFFTGLLFLSYLVLVCCLLDLATTGLFRIIAISLIILALLPGKSSIGTLRDLFNKLAPASKRSVLQYGVLLAVLALIVISLSPPTDADSLDYHLGIPVEILRSHGLHFDGRNLHFRMFGFGEMLNTLGIANGCPQLGAFIQLLGIVWLVIIFSNIISVDEVYHVAALIIGIPVMLFLMESQKHQITGAACSAVCFYVISQKNHELKGRLLLLLISSMIFMAGLKYSFILSFAVLLLLLVLKTKNVAIPIAGCIIGVCIFLAPMLIFKYLQYHDPLSPMLEQFSKNPNPVVLHMKTYIQQFKDSKFPFPLNLVLPSSFGYLSTVLGISGFVIATILFYYRRYKMETVAVVVFILGTTVLGQKTGRFFMEPYLWALPIFLSELQERKWFRYLVIGGQLQFFLLLPMLGYAAIELGRGSLSDKQRISVLTKHAAGYAESRWIDSLLPGNAVIATTIRSRALLPRPYFPKEYFSLMGMNRKIFDSLLLQNYKVDYLVIPDDMANTKFKGYHLKKIAVRTFNSATRNPFNSDQYTLSIFKIEK